MCIEVCQRLKFNFLRVSTSTVLLPEFAGFDFNFRRSTTFTKSNFNQSTILPSFVHNVEMLRQLIDHQTAADGALGREDVLDVLLQLIPAGDGLSWNDVVLVLGEFDLGR